MNKIVLSALLATGLNGSLCASPYKDESIQYEQVQLTAAEKQVLKATLDRLYTKYDPKEQMLTSVINGYNYHTDARTGTFHEVRSSLSYASSLLDYGDKPDSQQAFDIIKKVISLQDTALSSRTYGVWPYYQEEPLATKKSPVDFNWADFNGVTLLDIYTGHEAELPADLKATIRASLVAASVAIQKRDVQLSYTNIATMGTYVTFMVSHLFDLPALKTYSINRLHKFYDYTLAHGFTEYNSPTYTIVALDELERMRQHIVDADAKPKIDKMYHLAWEIIAKHYHQPSGQWAGPHSRSYHTLVAVPFYSLLKQASNGRINLPGAGAPGEPRLKHQIPEDLLPYFFTPKYPRTERDVLVVEDPKVIGTTYLTPKYALSTASRSCLWNQRRPFLAYWGTPEKPCYMQVRFLHDTYDFSSADFYAEQKENNVLAEINFSVDGGDKHISIDQIKGGTIKAKDLRLRFEFGNVKPDQLNVPASDHDLVALKLDGQQFDLQLFYAVFGQFKGHWEKGGDEKVSWIDYVFYNGDETDVDLAALNEAAMGFSCSVGEGDLSSKPEEPVVSKSGNLVSKWKGLSVSVPLKPSTQPKNL